MVLQTAIKILKPTNYNINSIELRKLIGSFVANKPNQTGEQEKVRNKTKEKKRE
jgi:predicted membrane protein